MGEAQDTEITLGTGKLLGIFFVIAAVCAVSFTMGYLLGRSSGPGSSSTTVVSAVPNGNAAGKPSAGGSKAVDTQNCPAGAANCTTAPSSTPPPFYSAASTKDPAPAQQQPVTLIVPPKSPDATPETTSSPAPEAKGSYMVQVAAVSKQEDAEILVNALRKKDYPVFSANAPGDSLFHVQVGPFSDFKDADAMRSRLAGDGYNAIVKK